MIDKSKVHFRIHESGIDGVYLVRIERFYTVRSTPKGNWVTSEYSFHWMKEEQLKERGYLKWISNTSRKRLCYPTIEEAINSFIIRKSRQLAILKSHIKQVEAVLNNRKEITIDKFSRGQTHMVINDIFNLKKEDRKLNEQSGDTTT